jgi:predicted permease
MADRRPPDDFNCEIEAHIRLDADRYRNRGMSEEDALAAARRTFGNVAKTQERFYESSRLLWWDALRQDIRVGVRLLAKTPSWTVVAVLTVALGIGGTAAIFSIVNAALLRPLPFPSSGHLYAVSETLKFGQSGLGPDYFTMRENLKRTYGASIQDMAAYDSGGVNWSEEDRAERFVAGQVTASFFSTLQVQPLHGRTFLPDEDRPGAEKVVLLSYSLWQRRFGSNPAIVGRRIRLDRAPALVIGIMPPSFDFPKGSDLWIPIAMDEAVQRQRKNMRIVGIIARSSGSATSAEVGAELDALMTVVKNEYPRSSSNQKGFAIGVVDSLRASAIPLQEQLVGNMRPVLLVFSGAVALMLLIVCFTVANLMLARATAKQREVAVRLALGSPRWRIVRQLLTESVLVSLLGGGFGLEFARVAITALNAVRQKVLPGLPEVGIDFRTAVFTFGITLVTGLVFGIAPSLGSIRLDMQEALQGESRSSSSRSGLRRMRQVLVVAQLGLSLTLLIGAGLLAKSFYHLRTINPGFHPENILTARVNLAGPSYSGIDRQRDFVNSLLENVSRLPGVLSAGIGAIPPGISGNSMLFRIDDQPAPDRVDGPRTWLIDTSAEYFSALGVPLVEGRHLLVTDRDGAPLVVVANDAFARKFFPGQSPIGHRVSTNPVDEDPRWAEIVGVVGSIRQAGLDQDVTPTLYRSYLQEPLPILVRSNLLIRTSGDPTLLTPSIERVLASMDRDQPLFDVKTMEERLSDSLISRRFNAALTGTFAAIATFLAAIGVYGMMSYLVTLRTSELGIRLAMGAQRGQILISVFREGISLALIGVALGVVGALTLSRFLASLLYGVGTHDPSTFVFAAITLVAAVMAACAIPGRRAAQIDPVIALRHD